MTGISENFYTIYKITNKTNGKFYIGLHETKDLLDGYMGSGISLKEDKSNMLNLKYKKEIDLVYSRLNKKKKDDTHIIFFLKTS